MNARNAFDGEGVVLVIGPAIAEDLPPVVREGLARRTLVNTGQTCPCGARLVVPSRAARRRAVRRQEVLHVTVEHEDDCPASDAAIEDALRSRRPR